MYIMRNNFKNSEQFIMDGQMALNTIKLSSSAEHLKSVYPGCNFIEQKLHQTLAIMKLLYVWNDRPCLQDTIITCFRIDNETITFNTPSFSQGEAASLNFFPESETNLGTVSVSQPFEYRPNPVIENVTSRTAILRYGILNVILPSFS